jgi:hypothetical protein
MSRRFKVVPEHIWKKFSKTMFDDNAEEIQRENELQIGEENILNDKTLPDDIKVKLFNMMDRTLKKEKLQRQSKPQLVKSVKNPKPVEIAPEILDPDAPGNIDGSFVVPPRYRSNARAGSILQKLWEQGIRYNDNGEIILADKKVLTDTDIFKTVRGLSTGSANLARGTVELAPLIPDEMLTEAVKENLFKMKGVKKPKSKKLNWDEVRFT